MKALTWLLFCLVAIPAHAKQFEVFDGQFYNNQYYPLIDMIEWGEQRGELPHMEFHVHSKEKRLEISAVAGEKNGRPVLWLNIEMPYRNERICRHVLAPAHFRKGMILTAYRDDKDPDYDNIWVSSEPVKGLTPYAMPAYQRCNDDNASNMPEEISDRKVASEQPAAAPAERAPAAAKKDGKGLDIDYENHAVPFSF
jgi:hypothetical protein